MLPLIGLVPLFPLIGFLIIGLFGKRLSKFLVGAIGSGSILLSFLTSICLFLHLKTMHTPSLTLHLTDWITSGKLSVPFELLVDPLSAIFLLVITGVGFLIHIYSIGYMHEDEGFARFFTYLNLFVFFMLVLVMGSNYLLMFVGWEGVGLCSYLLIGFWFKNTAYNNAAKKAFIMNRIGDLGFLMAILLLYVTFGSISFAQVFDQAKYFSFDKPVVTAITLLLFVGAIGKSAQLPLYTWLPDAMAGPTPVSALIHAATMVTAGIYMIARSNILFSLAPFTMEVVAVIGVVTAVFAASIGLFQNDIKKVLAYSTVSQLGLMFLALGVGAYTTGVFHVMTHAFFKALLFLGAGSVIHGMSGEQDIRKMGGLRQHLPITYFTFLIGSLAIAGIIPFAGFFSKDEILAHAWEHSPILWFFGMLASAMTSFYMFRLLFLTFWGEFRGTAAQAHHLHESPKTMTIPLIVLAVLSALGGFLGLPALFHAPHLLHNFLAPVFEASNSKLLPIEGGSALELNLMVVASLVAFGMIYLAYKYYITDGRLPKEEHEKLSPGHHLIYKTYYVNELYANVITKPLDWVSDKFYRFMELRVVDAIVNGIGNIVVAGSRVFRLLQTGSIEFYLLVMVVSIALLLFFK